MDPIIIRIQPDVYPMFIIYATCYSFLNKATTILDKDGTTIVAQIFPKGGISGQELEHAFHDELINQAHYFTQLDHTKHLTTQLVQRAFFSAQGGTLHEVTHVEKQRPTMGLRP